MKTMFLLILATVLGIVAFAVCKCASDKELEKEQQQSYIDIRWQEECKQAEIKAKEQYKKDSIECKGDLLKMSEKALNEAIAQDKASASGNIGHKAFNNI